MNCNSRNAVPRGFHPKMNALTDWQTLFAVQAGDYPFRHRRSAIPLPETPIFCVDRKPELHCPETCLGTRVRLADAHRACQPAPSPSDPPVRVLDVPSVTLDNVQATPLFAGLTPGLVGLYQINIRIPAGLADHTYDIGVSQSGAVNNTTSLPVKSPTVN
jgi:hypothetical protein